MNYKIIHDFGMLHDFIKWLPELQKNEKFFVCLQARKKYNPEVRSDKAQLKRFMCTKETLLSKLLQLECPYGAYQLDGKPVPQDSLVVYITPNPRDTRKAALTTISSIVTALSEENEKNYLEINPYQLALSSIHKTRSRSVFVHFDIDRPSVGDVGNAPKNKLTNSEIYDKLCEIVDPESFTLFETRGGCHILIKPELVTKTKNWFPVIRKEFNVDQSGDLMMPIPGCIQGGFIPFFYRN